MGTPSRSTQVMELGIERVRSGAGAVLAAVGLLWVSVDFAVRALLVMQALDIFSGLLAAWVTSRLGKFQPGALREPRESRARALRDSVG